LSSKGNRYICIFYIYDPTSIKGVAIKSRYRSKLLRVYQKVYTWCKSRGFKPKLHIMDNETPSNAKEFIASQNTGLQSTAPG
jgi:hypothetical protein